MRKTLFVLAIVALVAAGSTLCSAQTMKIGVFNPQRVSEETEEGKRIQAELTGFRNRKQQELASLEEAITGLQTQLSSQGLSLSPDRKAQLETDIQRRILELNGAREAAGRELQLEINTAQGKFQEQLLSVVEQFGRDEGFTVILDAGLVAWASQTIDVTTAIVDRFNTMVPATPPAADSGGGQ